MYVDLGAISGAVAAQAAGKLHQHLVRVWGRWPGWFTGLSAVQLPNGAYVIEVGIHPGCTRQTFPEVPSSVDGVPVIFTRGVVDIYDPRRMAVGGGWPLTRYGRPVR